MTNELKELQPPRVPALKKITLFKDYKPLVEDRFKEDVLYQNRSELVWEVYSRGKKLRKYMWTQVNASQ